MLAGMVGVSAEPDVSEPHGAVGLLPRVRDVAGEWAQGQRCPAPGLGPGGVGGVEGPDGHAFPGCRDGLVLEELGDPVVVGIGGGCEDCLDCLGVGEQFPDVHGGQGSRVHGDDSITDW